jgi:hypothetical protein
MFAQLAVSYIIRRRNVLGGIIYIFLSLELTQQFTYLITGIVRIGFELEKAL